MRFPGVTGQTRSGGYGFRPAGALRRDHCVLGEVTEVRDATFTI